MTQVMGVLNVTPDSFSDGGEHLAVDAAVARGVEMAAQGALVIDVGGESTRPGARPVDPTEEQSRVLPVIEALADRLGSTVRLSVDTRHESTARAAVLAGATLVNDVSASLWPVAADLGVGWVAMHMFGDPRTMQADPRYDDVVDDVRRFLVERALRAVDAGVAEVWVDPGIGFGKTTVHNLELLAHLDVLVDEGHPVPSAPAASASWASCSPAPTPASLRTALPPWVATHPPGTRCRWGTGWTVRWRRRCGP
ncbi:MAG: dihydropteroate synthase [Microthrixaceae bacterium]